MQKEPETKTGLVAAQTRNEKTVAHRAREEGQTSAGGNQNAAKGPKEDRMISSGNQHGTGGAREEDPSTCSNDGGNWHA